MSNLVSVGVLLRTSTHAYTARIHVKCGLNKPIQSINQIDQMFQIHACIERCKFDEDERHHDDHDDAS